MSDTLDPQLVLKVTPPRLPRTTHFRERLSIGNIEFRDRSVIEINAPAGFGKTTLLGQWRRESLNHGGLVAWLTLDENDHRPRFAQALAYAMRQASGRPGFERISGQAGLESSGSFETLTAWLAEVTFLGAEVRLILDEVQSAPTDTIEESLRYLLLNAPPNLRIVLASRRPLNLEIPDLTARGLYLKLGMEPIRLTQAETNAVLAARFGTQVTPDDCVRLHEKIGGWPLGLQLALAAIESKPNLSASIDALAAVHRNFEQYFLDKFVSGLDTAAVAILEDISILDTLRPELCRAVTARDDALEILADLRQRLPIFIDSGTCDWTRFHPMALDYLRGRLAQRDPQAVRELHERAACWLTDAGLNEEAAQHELAAGHPERAYALIGDNLHDMMIGGHQIRVLAWLDRIPPAEVERHPKMLLAAAWALAESERHAEVGPLITRLLAHPNLSDIDRFEGTIALAASYYFADQPDRTAEVLPAPSDELFASSLMLSAIYANARSTLLLYEGRPEQARQMIASAHARWPHGMDAVRGWGEWVVGFSYLWEGQVARAIDSLKDSLQRCEEQLGRRAGMTVVFAATLSEALFDGGLVSEAAAVLADRLDMIDRLAAPQSIAMGYRGAARAAVAGGHERRGFDLLEHLFALGENRGIPRFCLTSLGEQVKIHALRGRSESCQLACRRLNAVFAAWPEHPGGMLHSLLGLRVAIANAMAAMARRDWKAMLEILAPVSESTARLRRGRERIEAMQLTALARHHLGEDAQSLIGEAASLADLYGYRGSLLDTHPNLFAWYRSESSPPPGVEPPPRRSADTAPPRPRSTLPRGAGLLTAKEEEILGLLEKNLSNKHIGAALGVSGDTVKWHLRNLFGKLNAGSRKHAVDRARMLGILPETD